MKKKTLLVFLLATLSTATVAAVGCDNSHSHSYSPRHDAVSHWEECSCGNRKNIEEHVDVKNNDTQADGKDGKCDVCGLENHTVTFDMGNYADDVEKTVYSGGVPTAPSTENDNAIFKGWYTDKDCTDGNEYDLATPVTGDITVYAKWAEAVLVRFHMNGHGEAIPTVKLEKGGKAVKPVNPEAYGFTFVGWYTDSGCTEGKEFDFAAALDKSVDVYAKWTPLFSYIEIGGTGDATFGDKDVVGYIFKAPANGSGRYSVQLGGGAASQACRFTTTQDEDGVYYGKDETAAVKYFDLDAGEEIVFSITRKGDVANDVAVSVVVQEVTDEDLPAEGWLVGSYEGASCSFNLTDRKNKKLIYKNTEYAFTYVGGTVDTLTFKIPSPLGGGATIDFRAKRIKDESSDYEVLALSQLQGEDWVQIDTLYYTPEQRDVNVEEFAGVYKPKENGAVIGGMNEICIYPSGNGYYYENEKKKTFTLGSDGCNFDNGDSALTIRSNYSIKAVLDKAGEHVVGIKIVNTAGGKGSTNIAFYDRTGDAPDEVPTKLPLADDSEYLGAKLNLRCEYGSQYWGDSSRAITVTDFDKTTNTYTIEANAVTYKLVLTGEGENLSIAVYDNAGTLLDTLVKYFVDYKDLPTDATSETSLNLADFKKGFYHFKATADGWYSFNTSDENIAVYYGLSANYPTMTYYGNLLDFTDGAVSVYLAEGTVVGVQSLYTENAPASVSLTIGTTAAPMGFDESNPLVIDGSGLVSVDSLPYGTTLYVTFNPSEAGDYLINVSRMMYSTVYYTVGYSVNGTNVGFDYETYTWLGGLSADDPDYKISVSDINPITIVVFDRGLSVGEKYDNVTVRVTSDYKTGATEIAAEEFVDGTPAGGMLPKSVTKSSGKYLIKDTSGSDLVLTSSSAFTAKLNGVDIDVAESGGVYTATVSSGRNLYVEVSDTVTFTLSYAVGSEQAPIGIDFEGLKFTYGVESGETYFVFKEAGTFYATYTSNSGYFALNGNEIFGPFTAEVGDVLIVMQYYQEAAFSVEKSLPAAILGSYQYSGGDTKVTVTATAVTIGEKEYALSAISGDSYTFTAEDSSTVTLSVSGSTLTLDGNTLEVVDTSVFNKDQVGTYKTASGLPITLTLNADGSGTYSILSSKYEIEVTKDGDGFKFTYNDGRNVTFTFNGDGNAVVVDPAMGTNTLVKEAPAESGNVYTGTFETMGGSQAAIELTLNDDLTSGTLVMDDPDDPVSVNITLTGNGDNAYTFADGDAYWTGSFTINGDTVTITVDYTNITELALTKKA